MAAQQQDEIPLESVLSTLLNDESLSDLKLECKNAETVFAQRAVLAAHSKVF